MMANAVCIPKIAGTNKFQTGYLIFAGRIAPQGALPQCTPTTFPGEKKNAVAM